MLSLSRKRVRRGKIWFEKLTFRGIAEVIKRVKFSLRDIAEVIKRVMQRLEKGLKGQKEEAKRTVSSRRDTSASSSSGASASMTLVDRWRVLDHIKGKGC